ncbi:tetratricopeptide repeat protein [Thiolapillus sp.]
MDKKQWEKIKHIFNAAKDVSPLEREDCVRRLAGNDYALIDEVLSLLRASESATGFVDIPPAPLFVGTGNSLEGHTVGNYLIHHCLGHGGMGVVYLASRDDGIHEQKVALKILPDHYEPDLCLRFHQERRILAQLEHPGIARLLDGGNLPDGHPFYVMDYVQGMPIDKYCECNELSVCQILGLFINVCRAVHYAHQNLIVHRDIKPGNILVTDKGEIKLLDFGIAKLLNANNPAQSSDMTVMRQSMVTPSYGSPEQVMGKPVGTSSDVYSLGVLLYKLLTGNLPYQLDDDAPHTLTHAICSQEPRRLSEVSEDREKQLQGDLDNICLMALRKEPSRRYASAEAFAEDIDSFLNGYPVTATPDSLGYRFGKFARRNMGAVLAAGVLVLLVIGFSAYIYTQNNEIRDQAALAALERDAALKAKNLAEIEKATAEAAVTFMQEMFTSIDPGKTKGREIPVREILGIASEKLRQHEVLEDQPRVKATLHHTLGLTYMQLGDYPLAEIHQKSALKLRREVLGNEDPETLRAMNLLGILYFRQGRLEETERLWTEALHMRQKVLGPEAHRTLSSMSNLAILFIRMDKPAAAESMLKHTLEVERRVLGSSHIDTLTTQNNLAGFLNEKGRYRESEKLHRATLRARIESLGENHPDTLQSRYNIGLVLMDQEKYELAVGQFTQSLSGREKVIGETHPKTIHTMLMLARALALSGSYVEARPLFEKSLEMISGRQLANDEDLVRAKLYFALMLIEYYPDESARAALLIEDAWQRSHVAGKLHSLAVETSLGMAQLALTRGEPSQALKLIVEAEVGSLQRHGLKYSDTLAARQMRVETLLRMGRKKQAFPLAQEWLTACTGFFGEDHPRTIHARQVLDAF